MLPARWISLGRVAPLDFHAAYTGFAHAQADGAAPIIVCGCVGPHICLGQSQSLAELDESFEAAVVRRPLGGGAVWVDEAQLSYAIVAPRGLAPRRHEAWYGWALAPAVATFAAFGLSVMQVGEDLWLNGRKIAGSGSATLGRSAVVASSFLLRFPPERFVMAVASPSARYRECVREGLAAAMTDWESEAEVPAMAALEASFAAAFGESLGWAVAASEPDPDERRAIADWRVELAEPIERSGRRRVPDGLKLNAFLSVVASGEDARLVEKGGEA